MTTDAELRRILNTTTDELMSITNAVEIVDARDGMNVLTRMRESYEGWPKSSSFDSERGGEKREVVDMPYDTGDPTRPYVQVPTNVPVPRGDPVGEAATMRVDYAAAKRKQLEKAILSLPRIMRTIHDCLDPYELRNPNALELAETEEQPGCDSCARVPSPGSVGQPKKQQTGWWNAIDQTVTLTSGARVALCQWCRRGPIGANVTGELPPIRDVEAHRDGKRWKATA